MSYKKKKDTMTKTELMRDLEFWKAEYNRAKVVQRKIEEERDEALELLNAMPEVLVNLYRNINERKKGK